MRSERPTRRSQALDVARVHYRQNARAAYYVKASNFELGPDIAHFVFDELHHCLTQGVFVFVFEHRINEVSGRGYLRADDACQESASKVIAVTFHFAFSSAAVR